MFEYWRTSISRVVLSYGVFFTIWAVCLLNLLQWTTSHYLSAETDRNLVQQIRYLGSLDRQRMLTSLHDYVALETREFNSWGLFDSGGHPLYGNVDRLPGEIEVDGPVHAFSTDRRIHVWYGPGIEVRAIARRLDDGDILLLARDTSMISRVGAIIHNALWWGLLLTLVPGLLGGYWMGRGAIQRIRQLELAILPLRRGDLGQRLPVSSRRDELDQLADIVNVTLGEVERLMGEVKGVCDSIAHDLRTPLTRLRAQLYRLAQGEHDPAREAMLENCVAETDELLGRFRALLRISELEDRHRRAGFVIVDLGECLYRVYELYAPLAEDKDVEMRIELVETPGVQGDPGLLLEAVGNLVSNAIKFTPNHGKVGIQLTLDADGAPRITVSDTGPGIPAALRASVLQRFFRTESSQEVEGHGLGLSIVAAITKLHGFRLEIGGHDGGAMISIRCRAELLKSD
ncbi:sensor histidine kinase [Frateuria aurantia]